MLGIINKEKGKQNPTVNIKTSGHFLKLTGERADGR